MKKINHKPANVIILLLCILFSFILMTIIMFNVPVLAQDKQSDLIITTLFDKYSSNSELTTGWGYSCLIQGAEKTILFDTGSYTLFGGSGAVKNCEMLNIDPKSIDVMFISHDHFDHTGGMLAFKEKNHKIISYIVPHSPVEICRNVFSTGDMSTGTEINENALIIKTVKGLVVITGCSHPGIVNIVQKAKSMFQKDEVYLVMGGFHLFEGRSNTKNIALDLKKENVRKVAPSHCTGEGAESVFKEVFGTDYIPGDVGKPVIIEGAFNKTVNLD